jgi:hypothetical protein
MAKKLRPTFDATADKISLVTSNGLRHRCVLPFGRFVFPRQDYRVPLPTFVARRFSATFFALLTLYGVKVDTYGIVEGGSTSDRLAV